MNRLGQIQPASSVADPEMVSGIRSNPLPAPPPRF